MANKSHHNNALRTIVKQKRDGVEHSTAVHVNLSCTVYTGCCQILEDFARLFCSISIDRSSL